MQAHCNVSPDDVGLVAAQPLGRWRRVRGTEWLGARSFATSCRAVQPPSIMSRPVLSTSRGKRSRPVVELP